MGEYFRSARCCENLRAPMGLESAWKINLMRLPTVAVLSYEDLRRRFPAHLQQLEMGSNGESVTLDGKPTDCDTAAVIWGEPGNNAQHSLVQLLHQGMHRLSGAGFFATREFLLLQPGAPEPGHRELPGAGRRVHDAAVGRLSIGEDRST